MLLFCGAAFALLLLTVLPVIGHGSYGTQWLVEQTPLDRSAEQLAEDTQEHLAAAKAIREQIGEVKGERTFDNTLRPYNELMMHLDAASNECGLFARIHPDAEVRKAAEEGEQATAKALTEINLDRELYEAFQRVNIAGADAATQWFVEKRLRDFRRAGVDKSSEVRAQIAALNEAIVKLGQEFAKIIRNDEREIVLDSASDLAGLPADWIARHSPDAEGKIRVTTRTPDYVPFMTYAWNSEARRRLYIEHKGRGYPANLAVLQELLIKRHQLARLLGYATWADYITEDKMIGSAAGARSFIDRVAGVSLTAAQKERDVLLARKRKDDPTAMTVHDWEKSYYEELVKSEDFGFDSQALRPYLDFKRVQQGLFDLTSKLFGVTYRKVEGLKLWHPQVTAWDVLEGSRHIGRFYLDLHPRKDKYGHAAQFDYRAGIRGRRVPQSVLVCNFTNPAENADGVALMEHSDVLTFFHEFGHLLHALLGGHQEWIGNTGISTEWDFVEVPSQILEEWCYHPESLRLFARHHQTDEPIPMDLVQKLHKARDFGKGLYAAHQMFYAAVSLSYYSTPDPAGLDTTATLIELQRRYSPFDYVEGTHFQCSFGHLEGYSAIYYTYMWSLAIAKDLLSVFEREGFLNPQTARRYRQSILDPGGSKKAERLVADFLGRPFSFEAFERWLMK